MIKKTSRKYYRAEKLLIKIGKNLRRYRRKMGMSLKTILDIVI